MTPSRLPGAGLAVLSLGAALVRGAALVASAEEQSVTAIPIRSFMSAAVGQPVQGLIWRGGIEMKSPIDTFGGLSGLGFLGNDGRLVMVSDRGNFISGQLIYDEAGQPLSLIGVRVDPMRNSKGNELPRAYARDAESLAVVERDGIPSAVRVGFENLTRVADFALAHRDVVASVEINPFLVTERGGFALDALIAWTAPSPT